MLACLHTSHLISRGWRTPNPNPKPKTHARKEVINRVSKANPPRGNSSPLPPSRPSHLLPKRNSQPPFRLLHHLYFIFIVIFFPSPAQHRLQPARLGVVHGVVCLVLLGLLWSAYRGEAVIEETLVLAVLGDFGGVCGY